MSGRNPDAENFRLSTIRAWLEIVAPQPWIMQAEWNIGIDTYAMSSRPMNIAASGPHGVILRCVMRTALGSPLVPDVKMSMNRLCSSMPSGAFTGLPVSCADGRRVRRVVGHEHTVGSEPVTQSLECVDVLLLGDEELAVGARDVGARARRRGASG